MKKIPTIREAAILWAENWFDHVPTSCVDNLSLEVLRDNYDYNEALMMNQRKTFYLIASPRTECLECRSEYKGTLNIDEMYKLWKNGKGIRCPYCKQDCWDLGYPCERGLLYAPKKKEDIKWIQSHRNNVAQLGFYVYHSEKYGVMLGYDNRDIDLEECPYEVLWIPLYKLRGLQWHETN